MIRVEPRDTNREVEELLGDIITTCISGPGGDPDWCHMISAAKAFVALEKLGLKPRNGDDTDFTEHEFCCHGKDPDGIDYEDGIDYIADVLSGIEQKREIREKKGK